LQCVLQYVAACCSVFCCVMIHQCVGCGDTGYTSVSPLPRALLHHAHLCITTQHNTLQRIATYCDTLQHTLHSALQYSATQTCNGTIGCASVWLIFLVHTPCNTLSHTATHCNTLHYTLQHTTTHCNIDANISRRYTLQHTATHCNTLQHTATHIATYYNTLQHRLAMTTQAVRSFRRYLSNTCTATH